MKNPKYSKATPESVKVFIVDDAARLIRKAALIEKTDLADASLKACKEYFDIAYPAWDDEMKKKVIPYAFVHARGTSMTEDYYYWSLKREAAAKGLNTLKIEKEPWIYSDGRSFRPDIRIGSLLVEIDGPVHKKKYEEDIEREEALRELGYDIIRFTAPEVTADIDRVVRETLKAWME